MSRYIMAIAGLTAVYVLVLASFNPWDLAAGAVFATALVRGSRRFVFDGSNGSIARLPRRVLWFIPFAAVVCWQIVVGTMQVLLVVLHLRPLSHPGLVALPFDERTPHGVAVWSLALTLSPGSFPVDFDMEQRVMLVHFLDASNPDAIRAEQRQFYQRVQRHVFP